MSMHLEFEPHSWYYEFAIKHDLNYNDPCEFDYSTDSKLCIVHDNRTYHPLNSYCTDYAPKWSAYTVSGMTYSIIMLTAPTLKGLQSEIRKYWLRDNGRKVPAYYAKRLFKSPEAKHIKEPA
jgi:hypothetical protein